MYIEQGGGLADAGRIGRVTFSKTGKTVHYGGRTLISTKSGYKYNHLDQDTREEYWSRDHEGTDRTRSTLAWLRSTMIFARSTGATSVRCRKTHTSHPFDRLGGTPSTRLDESSV